MRKILWIALIVIVVLLIGAGVAFATRRQAAKTNIKPIGSLVVAITINPPVAGSAFGSQTAQVTPYGQHEKAAQYKCTILAGDQASEVLTLKYQFRNGSTVLEEIDGCATLSEFLQKQPVPPILVNGGIPANAQGVHSQVICLAPSPSSSVTVSVISAQHGLKIEGQGQHSCP